MADVLREQMFYLRTSIYYISTKSCKFQVCKLRKNHICHAIAFFNFPINRVDRYDF